MKTKIATALSIVGVLGAGSAAALVNTQILDSGSTQSGASAAVLPEPAPIDLTVPETASERSPVSTVATADPTTTVPDTTLPATGSPQSASDASGMLTAFNVGDAGVVTVDVIAGQLVLVSAEPKAGWTLAKAEDDSNDDSDSVENEVEVEFTSASVRVEFEAHLVDGRIVPKVESEAIGGTILNAAPAVPNTVVDDDDRDDHDEDEDHDDDHEDEDHDDDEDEDHDDDHEDEEDDHDEDEDDDRDDD